MPVEHRHHNVMVKMQVLDVECWVPIPAPPCTSCVTSASYLTSLGNDFFLLRGGGVKNTYRMFSMVKIQCDDASKAPKMTPGT